MCLAIPAMLISIDKDRGIVVKAGLELEVDLTFVPEAKIGDHLIIHAGMALSIMDDQDVRETLKLLDQELNNG